MEKQFNREDELMKRLLNEAGNEKPSADFKRRLMMKIEARNTAISPYTPLISRSAWVSIAVIFVISMIGLTYLYADISMSDYWNIKFPQLINIPKLELSRTMQYAIAFVALFFLQVPFLKRYLDREYL